MFKVHASALFCDDVRQEIGGKMTVVGVYGNVLGLIGEAAPVIPKFVCLLMLSYAQQEAPARGRVKVLDGDKALLDVPLPLTIPPRPGPAARPGDLVNLNVPMEFIGFPVRDGMVLRIRFECEGFNWESQTLELRTQPPKAT
jgi:hypothetical protein